MIAAVACLWGSTAQLREFRQWSRIRDGDGAMRFDASDAESWQALGQRRLGDPSTPRPSTTSAFATALDRRPASGAALWGLFLAASDPQTARALAEAALRVDPTHASWRLRYADLLDRQGLHDEALAQVEQAARLSPTLASHPYLAGDQRTLENVALMTAVERGFREAMRDHADDPRITADLAELYDRLGRAAEAADLWERAEAGAPPDRQGTYAIRAGTSRVHAGDLPRAERVLRRALESVPNVAEAYLRLADDVLRPAHRYDEALRVLADGVRRADDPMPLYLARYRLETERGDRAAAAAALTDAVERRPSDAMLRFQLGLAHLQAGDLHRARASFGQAIALEPSRAEFHFHRGVVSEQLLDMRDARSEYAEAARLDPANARYVESAARLARAFDESPHERGERR